MRDDDEIDFGKLALIFIGFALLYFLTAVHYGRVIETNQHEIVDSMTVEPIRTYRRNEVLEVSIRDTLVTQGWSYVETELLTQDKQTVLTSFGGEHWQESGISEGERWSESKQHSDIRLTIPEPGTYFLRFKAEKGRTGSLRSTMVTDFTGIQVVVRRLKGTSTLFNWAGLVLLVIGVGLNEIHNKTIQKMIAALE